MLEAKHVSYSYRDGLFSLHDVGFSLGRGQIAGLLGDNGAGKTTLMRCLAGLLSPESGEVTLDGEKSEAMCAKIAYISGEGASVGSFTPMQTQHFLADFYPRFDAQRYRRLLDFFELPNRPVHQMSTGERAKAELTAGISLGADYILMDEPFSGKDVFTRRDFLKIMAGSLRDNETILLTTHLVEEVESFLDRVLVLHEGRLVCDTQIDELHSEGGTLLTLLKQTTGYDEQRAGRLFLEEN